MFATIYYNFRPEFIIDSAVRFETIERSVPVKVARTAFLFPFAGIIALSAPQLMAQFRGGISGCGGPGNDPASWSSLGKDIGYNQIRSHYPDRPKGFLMRATPFFSALLLAYAGVSHAALGGLPEQFNTQGTTVVSSVSSAGPNYVTRDTTLATGTHVREYVSGSGVVFAVTWDGPFLPDLKALLGKYFDTMVAESATRPRAGRSRIAVNRPEVVINSGGHMRAFEGSAWIPAEFPAGFTADDVH